MVQQPDKLTPEEKQRAEAWLREKWVGNKMCPVSLDNNWSITDHLVQPLTMTGDAGLSIGGPGYPVFQVVCLGCGYTMYFNAVVAGLRPASPPPLPPPTPTQAEQPEASDAG